MKLPSDGWLTLFVISIGAVLAGMGIYEGAVEENWAQGTFYLIFGLYTLEKA